ncbi:MAG: tetratricopeptide repeat protein, partial [Bacteroidota bacterium]
IVEASRCSIPSIVGLLLALAIAGCAPPTHISLDGIRVDSAIAPPNSRLAKKLADRLFMDGSLLQMRQQYAEAIERYERARWLAPGRGAIAFAISRCYRALGSSDSALFYARASLSSDSANIDIREQLAELFLTRGLIDGAIEQYEAMLRLQPDDLSARYTVARLLQRRRPSRSIYHYEYIRKYLGEDYDALLNLSELYLNQEQYDSAVGVIRQVITLDPQNPDIYKILNDTYLRASRYDDALKLVDELETRILPDSLRQAFLIDRMVDVSHQVGRAGTPREFIDYARALGSRVAKRFPDQWEVSFYYGKLRHSLGDSSAADSLIARALASKYSTVGAWREAAKLYLDNGETVRALRVLPATSYRFRNDSRVLDYLGGLYFTAGRYDSSEKYLRKSLAVDDDNSVAWSRLALIYKRQGKPGASDAAYEKALEFDPDDPSILNNYAYSLAERKLHLDKALEMIKRALDDEPENESYLDTIGWIYFRLGDYQHALQYIRHSVEIGGAVAEVLEHLGDTESALGDKDAARDAYGRALKLNPASTQIQQKYDATGR